MTTEVYETATGNQFAIFMDANRALASLNHLPGFEVRNGPRLDVPAGLMAERFPRDTDGETYRNLRQYRTLSGSAPALLVEHLGSGVVFYKSVEDFA